MTTTTTTTTTTTLVNKMTRSKSVESQLSKGLTSFKRCSTSIKRSQSSIISSSSSSSFSLLNQKPAKQPKLPKRKRKVIALNNLIPFQQIGEYDADGHNTKEAVTLLNREGYFVKDSVLTCSKEIEEMKRFAKQLENRMVRMPKKKKEYVFSQLVTTKSGHKKSIKSKDRQILEFGVGTIGGGGDDDDDGDSSVIPNCFKKDFNDIIKLLHKIADECGNTIWDLNSVECSAILSHCNSSMQQLHFDFNPVGTWTDYDKVFNECRVSPSLSLLYFPYGGYLVVYPCDPSSAKDYRDCLRVYKEEEAKLKIKQGTWVRKLIKMNTH